MQCKWLDVVGYLTVYSSSWHGLKLWSVQPSILEMAQENKRDAQTCKGTLYMKERVMRVVIHKKSDKISRMAGMS